MKIRRPSIPPPSREEIRRQGRLLRAYRHHPRIALAIRGAIATALAWWIALLLPAPMSEYPYYAPLGAVVATTMTVAGSVRESVRAVTAVLLGGGIAFAADWWASSADPVTIALAVALSILVGGWRWLGTLGSWAPMAALFTLVIAGGEAFYVGAYAGLMLLGAAIGVGVNFVFPPLPLAPLRQVLSRMRKTLGDQLGALAGALENDEMLDEEAWAERKHDLEPLRSEMRQALDTAREARRANQRARRYAVDYDRLARQAYAFDRISLLVADLTDLLAEREIAGRDEVALGPRLRPATAEVLHHLENVVRDAGGDGPEEARAAGDSLERLVVEIDRSHSDRISGSTMAAAALAMAIRRSLDELAVLYAD
ncbi:aromatic acid exporter family protein [Georgenia halophila]|uniref:Aromatic acid exporter family protein n=1 Tax=Georgenia halophila TaxID=620889 RepID=A0ABP8LID4_9MICO